jgi:hypothetical protein
MACEQKRFLTKFENKFRCVGPKLFKFDLYDTHVKQDTEIRAVYRLIQLYLMKINEITGKP